ncbi:MAG: succinate--CoA ligase subunit alpha [Chloroflexi bacterium UTCFX4]|jgi:succinyl-CoA synthetase alpha subunit|nr:MAG: succinate--CoA ligase subunit alpha [Chloroflexi bacterium UTCFX4]
MSILVDKNTRLLVQGITGREGMFHTKNSIEYGTNVVAGVTPGRGGETVLDVPIFNTVREAVRETGANVSVIYVPAGGAADAMLEASAAGIPLVVCITERVPVQDMMRVKNEFNARGTKLIGPNCPGLISPAQAKVGIIPGNICIPGPVGLVSRSGTLTYEVVDALTRQGNGQSTCVGIGGDPVRGLNFIEILELFQNDPETRAIITIGEIGGTDEEKAAAYIKAHVTKPVVAFIAGQTAPPGKRMGHAGAIIEGGTGTAEEKIKAFRSVGVPVARYPVECAELIAQVL